MLASTARPSSAQVDAAQNVPLAPSRSTQRRSPIRQGPRHSEAQARIQRLPARLSAAAKQLVHAAERSGVKYAEGRRMHELRDEQEQPANLKTSRSARSARPL
jgi:hypothetical protein